MAGESYDAYIQEHVLRAAGMLHTDSRPAIERVEGRAIGYIREPNGLVPNIATMPWSGTSAGGGYSTVGDLLLFAQALQTGKLLAPALLAEATQRDASRRGYGLGFYTMPDGAYGHGGGAPGINGELRILPHDGYVLVALANRDPRVATDLADYITSALPKDDHRVASVTGSATAAPDRLANR